MATERLTVSLAPELRSWIDSAIDNGGYSSASDFVATLVRNHRRAEQLDQLLAEGLESGVAVQPDDNFWAAKKAALAKRSSS
uniref:Type II toxin-antitoxin system ParD family antitoxin n=1 Tax=OCS116 cluster bacterium TaxID=2030921 RepID=A0A2A4Z6L6_9PROT